MALQQRLAADKLYKTTVLNSAMKPAAPPVLRATRLLDQIRERIRYKHYSLRTEQAYVQWVRVFVKWQGVRHPRDIGARGDRGVSGDVGQRASGGSIHAQPRR